MESKFKVGEIVRHDHSRYTRKGYITDEDPICKIIEIKGGKIYHIHRGSSTQRAYRAPVQEFESLPRLLRILYDF